MTLCVLVAEDEMIIGVDLCDTVEEAGFEVAGPFDTTESAIDAVERRKPDLAILDINLDDGEVYPLAEKLMAENVPVIFHSGQVKPGEVFSRYPQAHALAKPCPPSEVIATMREALAAA
ncbi:putative transcriptional regulatory protein pdtaR [Tsuneonella dongtanensis]|uniref:Putative transcriptional regulatory protein pdtaR n=1 Tax=Tsuneonella dongtanensis TaxID=692370 RepID=A0A1B2AFQ2_9SPHN|nr:response regulator [Tsuneonella dongtanensis]ANY20983.1 putative transcriptional regulatory protein pdtaR [Tsuneonella dongtanensis]